LSRRLGLVVNPRAGLGGRVGLKGSDGAAIQEKALELGAAPQAVQRAALALSELRVIREGIEVVTYPGEMGADAVSGYETRIVGSITESRTTALDTRAAALKMLESGVDLLLFAGGDGTARDIYDAIGMALPVLGIPAGVKMHSAVFATSPRAAGRLAAVLIRQQALSFREAEVMDIDEEMLRQGIVSARLYGYLRIPDEPQFLQSCKSGSSPDEHAAARAIARSIIDEMSSGVIYIVGPGTTTRALTAELGLEKTLTGVDVLLDRRLLARDVNEQRLLALLETHHAAKIVVTPVGGQGYVFGRGNQQLSPRVIRRVGADNIMVVSTAQKLAALHGKPLLIDTGEEETDRSLEGYVRVVTGRHESVIYRMARDSFSGLV
jgi:predicted polyphosphate/ATP-dependent NAD kinase